MKLHGCAKVMQGGTDVQDLTAMFLQLVESGAANIERSFQIDIDHRPKTVGRKLFRLTQKISGGTIHYNIDLPKLFDGGRDRIFNLLWFAHVSGHSERLATSLVDGCSSGYEMVHLAANQRHRGAGFSKRPRHSASDTRATASDEGDPTF